MPFSHHPTGITPRAHEDGSRGIASSSTGSTGSTRLSPPFLKAEDVVRNTLSSLGRDGLTMSLEEFSTYHNPVHSSLPPTRQSLWAVSFPRHRRDASITQTFSWIYHEFFYPLVRFEVTILATKFDGPNLHVKSSFRTICEDPIEDIAARGDLSDFFHPDHDVDGRYYLVHRALTFTTVRRPELLARRLRTKPNAKAMTSASSSYDSYLRLSYFARRLRELKTALYPSLALSALAASIAANPTASFEVRSGCAITGTVISSISCVLSMASIVVEILEGRIIRLILEVTPPVSSSVDVIPPASSSVVRSNILRRISSLKRCAAILIALAAVAASIAAHPGIPQDTRKAFAIAGVVLAATGCVLYILSSATSTFSEESRVFRSREGGV
ncbi:hypothetical protein BT69DRAFT_23134 [Atractiella rhizophila]|nr:hypothetical protein BT69DRAFT_23134 [Atractiella rhizophila]